MSRHISPGFACSAPQVSSFTRSKSAMTRPNPLFCCHQPLRAIKIGVFQSARKDLSRPLFAFAIMIRYGIVRERVLTMQKLSPCMDPASDPMRAWFVPTKRRFALHLWHRRAGRPPGLLAGTGARVVQFVLPKHQFALARHPRRASQAAGGAVRFVQFVLPKTRFPTPFPSKKTFPIFS